MYFNRHGTGTRQEGRERNIRIDKNKPDRSYILPYALAWVSAVFLLIIIIFDLPVLLRPHAVAAVSGVGELDAGVVDDETPDYNVFLENGKKNIYVRYVAMGEERTSILKNAPKGLEKNDIVIVSYSSGDPYDVSALRIYRYIFHAFVLLFCLIVFGYLWHSYNNREFARKLAERRNKRFF